MNLGVRLRRRDEPAVAGVGGEIDEPRTARRGLGAVLRRREVLGEAAPVAVGTKGRFATVAGLLPAIDVDGPRVRLGVAWAAVTGVAAIAGPVATALVFAAVALAAAGQATTTWRATSPRRRRDPSSDRRAAERGAAERRPYRPVAVAGAAVCALAGAASPLAVVAAAVVTAVAGVSAQQLRFGGRAWDARSTVAIAVTIGAAAATPAVVVDQLGLVPGLVLLALVHVIDASTFVVGSGATNRWEGSVAGLASAAAVALAVAAVLVPPFRGASPWVLAVLAAALVPAGGVVGSLLLGPRDAPFVPALRRLDALLVLGPVWLLAGRLLLDLG